MSGIQFKASAKTLVLKSAHKNTFLFVKSQLSLDQRGIFLELRGIHVLVIVSVHRLSEVFPKYFWTTVAIFLLQSSIFSFFGIIDRATLLDKMLR